MKTVSNDGNMPNILKNVHLFGQELSEQYKE